jgi:CheY-like chemotaxis protein
MTKSILLVEDDEDDVFLMERALQATKITLPMNVVEHGRAAVEYLSGTGRFADRVRFPIPTVVFLDLKLPYKSGHEVLEWVRQQPEFQKLVVIILTASEETVDLARAYKLGCNSYLVKPPKAQELLDTAKAFNWA